MSLNTFADISNTLQILKNSSTRSSRTLRLFRTLAYNNSYVMPESRDNFFKFTLFSFKYLPTLSVVPFTIISSSTSYPAFCSFSKLFTASSIIPNTLSWLFSSRYGAILMMLSSVLSVSSISRFSFFMFSPHFLLPLFTLYLPMLLLSISFCYLSLLFLLTF